MRTGFIRAAVATLWIVLCFSAVPAETQEKGTSGQIFQQLPEAEGDQYWQLVAQLEELGEDSLKEIERGARRPVPKIKIAAARALYAAGRKADAVEIWLDLVEQSGGQNAHLAAEALAFSFRTDGEEFSDRSELEERLQDALDAAEDPRLKVTLYRALWSVSRNVRAPRELRDLLNSSDPDVRAEAALALAEANHYESADPVLRELEKLPTSRGALARLYRERQLTLNDRMRDLGRATPHKLLDEIIRLCQQLYVDPERISERQLEEAAARGIGQYLDPFSNYLDEREWKQLNESIKMKYGGIGAHVSMRDNVLTIERPVYSGPAYKAGLRSLDRITEVEGDPTFGKDLLELVSDLKGDPGNEVRIKVSRRGWKEEREFVLSREAIQIDTARGDVLPGNVGYVQITSFGDTTARELGKVLSRLQQQGVQALIFDLRNNAGGYLQAALEILELFLPNGKLLLLTKNKDGVVLEKHVAQDDDEVVLPLFVLVNQGSASASEIFAGVLQDYQKAVIIGEPTYGKGSVQQVRLLSSMGSKSAFRMTVAKYYLPSGRSIDRPRDQFSRTKGEGGIQPDLKVEAPEVDLWKAHERSKILDARTIEGYLERNYTPQRETFLKLAENDAKDPGKYPDFEKLYQEAGSRLEHEDLRELVRQELRRWAQDDLGREFLHDYQEDIQLQRGILEALKTTHVDPKSVEPYRSFARLADSVAGNTPESQK